jgi:adenosylhomocysteine nucleosidase
MNETKPASVAVICAMDSEAAHLRRRLSNPSEQPLSVWRRTRGFIESVPVELVVSGIGLVNAGAATAVLCAARRPRAIINYGCSGAHREDVDPGDVILGERVVHFSSQIITPSGERQYKGFWYEIGEQRVEIDAIPADPGLLDVATTMAGRQLLPAWPGVAHEPRIHVGTVASADVWTQHGESIRELHGLHGSLCEEMEAAAVAQVAAIYGVPFLAVKDISNNELMTVTNLDETGALTLDHIREHIALRAALVVEATIAALGATA